MNRKRLSGGTAADISLRKLNYTYPGETSPALRDLDLAVRKGEFVGMIGASGSGKTTLIKCMSGLIPHELGGKLSGEVRIRGENMTGKDLHDHTKHIGMVFQNPHLQQFSDRVVEELAFPLENFRMPRKEMRERIRRTINEFGLKKLIQRDIHDLSGGEKQLLAIATALIRKPGILILDEPTSELDPENTQRVRSILARYCNKLTMILVEHRPELLQLCHRIIGIAGGKIVCDGPPDSILTSSTYGKLGAAPPQELVMKERLGGRWDKITGVRS